MSIWDKIFDDILGFDPAPTPTPPPPPPPTMPKPSLDVSSLDPLGFTTSTSEKRTLASYREETEDNQQSSTPLGLGFGIGV